MTIKFSHWLLIFYFYTWFSLSFSCQTQVLDPKDKSSEKHYSKTHKLRPFSYQLINHIPNLFFHSIVNVYMWTCNAIYIYMFYLWGGGIMVQLPVQSVQIIKLWVGTRSWRGALDTTLCDKVYQWFCNRSVVFSSFLHQ